METGPHSADIARMCCYFIKSMTIFVRSLKTTAISGRFA